MTEVCGPGMGAAIPVFGKAAGSSKFEDSRLKPGFKLEPENFELPHHHQALVGFGGALQNGSVSGRVGKR